MKKNKQLIAGLAAIAATALVVYTVRRINHRRRLSKVAEEGYETAHDILYPHKTKGSQKLTYGPVLPE